MAIYQGAIVFLKTAAGSIPAITTAHYDAQGARADVAAGSAVTVDITTLTSQSTKLTGVTVEGATQSFATRNDVTAGQVFIPA